MTHAQLIISQVLKYKVRKDVNYVVLFANSSIHSLNQLKNYDVKV